MSGGALLAGVFLSLVASVVPTCLWAGLVWWCDRYEREPIPLAAAAFLWGAFPAVALSLAAEFVFDGSQPGMGGSLLSIGGMAPLAEECAKGAMLLVILWLWPGELDDMLDGILYGAMVGFGFGMTENFLYTVGALGDGSWTSWGVLVFMRDVVFGLNHAFFTAFTGAALGYARMAQTRRVRLIVPVLGLGAAVATHAVHNLGAAMAEVAPMGLAISLANDGGGVLLVIVMIALALGQERRWLRTELAGEVGQWLSDTEYGRLLSVHGRMVMLDAARRAGGWRAVATAGRFQQVATELAFRKHRLRARGPDQRTAADIDQLVARLKETRTLLGWGEIGGEAM